MRRIDFLATDGVLSNGILYESKEKTKNIVIAVHGMASHCFKTRDLAISKTMNENNIDYFCFNNRGSELVKYIKKITDGKVSQRLGGTAYEDVLEGYEDIVGAILKVKELGYENIYLQGHSLGCTKIVYTYNELKKEESEDILQNIKGVILLSLIDIPSVLKEYLGEKWEEYMSFAEEKEEEGKIKEFMPKDSFIHMVSVKTFLRYARDNQEIDFANYGEDRELELLNQITVPIFMRWGNENEMILQPAEELIKIVNNKITNPQKDINYIDGSNHMYTGKEKILAEQIKEFIQKNEK